MGALEIGQALVEAAKKGQEAEHAFVDQYYSPNIVSIEGGGDAEDMPARIEGIEAILGKHQWWFDNNTVHGTEAVGPFIGHRDDQFVVQFTMDITPNGGERMQMVEVGLYTLVDDKIVQEEYLYQM